MKLDGFHFALIALIVLLAIYFGSGFVEGWQTAHCGSFDQGMCNGRSGSAAYCEACGDCQWTFNSCVRKSGGGGQTERGRGRGGAIYG